MNLLIIIIYRIVLDKIMYIGYQNRFLVSISANNFFLLFKILKRNEVFFFLIRIYYYELFELHVEKFVFIHLVSNYMSTTYI